MNKTKNFWTDIDIIPNNNRQPGLPGGANKAPIRLILAAVGALKFANDNDITSAYVPYTPVSGFALTCWHQNEWRISISINNRESCFLMFLGYELEMETGQLWATFCAWLAPWLQKNLATLSTALSSHIIKPLWLHTSDDVVQYSISRGMQQTQNSTVWWPTNNNGLNSIVLCNVTQQIPITVKYS